MSTDTMYFNSSRLMSASSKNKTNSVTRLDKKRIQADRKNKVRQETIDIPQPQTLPNGGKPDFGHSNAGSRRKQRSSSSEKRTSSSGSDRKQKKGDTEQVTESLKQLFLKPERNPKLKHKGNDSDDAKNGKKQEVTTGSNSESRSVSSPGTAGRLDSTPPIATVPLQSHDFNVSPSNFSPVQQQPIPVQQQHPVSSPLFVHPGLYPMPPPSSAPQQQHMGFSGYPYGNYSLTSSTTIPQFMAPQAPLLNPMYPQPPLTQLPLMYKALDIQQHQLAHQQHQQHQPPQQQFQSVQQLQAQQPQQHSLPSRPLSASYPTSTQAKMVKPYTGLESTTRSGNQRRGNNTSFAGASFASSNPKVNNLPKPSFTKA